MIKKISIILLFSIITVNLFGQEFSLLKAIREQFSAEEQQQLDLAQQKIEKGDELKNLGQDLLKKYKANNDENLKNQAYQNLIKGSENYFEANSTFFNLYFKNLNSLVKTLSGEQKQQIENLINNAQSYIDKAKQVKISAKNIKNLEQKYEKYSLAEQYEQQALGLLINGYAIYFNYVRSQQTPPKKYKPTVSTSKDKIYYRVQIAASKVPLSEAKLKKIYPNMKTVFVDYHNGMFKYLVGRYYSYEDAQKAKEKINVKGAFIVAYKNDKRVNDINEVYQKP